MVIWEGADITLVTLGEHVCAKFEVRIELERMFWSNRKNNGCEMIFSNILYG